MLECKYCRRPFPTPYARTQHLRQRPYCNRLYKHEIAALASQNRTWQVDDPEAMPENMEGHGLEPMDEGLDNPVEGQERGADQGETDDEENKGGADGFWGSTLFEEYLATVSAKSPSESTAVPVGW